ncbi:sensor histidine kinase [Lacibacter sp.]|uniref:tetratricopeptide repeat-containing sensor histidine kinase n=1 Tax=Lacibacter sp. TaxID=1915409 RepID=UPI002B4B7D99|nr:sensor histidine kinase [Lacibacter sp.]HLP35326.1 sensor histidine kinase [Lacibacter sp.]
MRSVIAYLLFILAVSASTHSYAQTPKTDSLRKLISSEKDIDRKMDLLLLLSNEFRMRNPDSSAKVTDELVKLAGKQHNETMQLRAEVNKVYYYMNMSKPDSGLLLSSKNIRLLDKVQGTDSLQSQYHSAAGLALMRMNRQKEAMEQFYMALKKAEKGNEKVVMVKSLHNIGWAYMELNQFKEAIQHFRSSIDLAEEIKLPARFAVSYNNLASCYGALKQYDSVYKFVKQGIRIAQQQKNSEAEANGWNIMGTAYTAERKYREALDCFLKAKPIREKTGDAFFIVSDLAVLSELYALINNSAEGLRTGNEALRIAQEKNLQAKFPMIYKAIALNYEKAGNYAAASELYKKMNDLKDSTYSHASEEALAEMKTKYETEKKEKIIQEQQFNLTRKNYLITGISLILIFGLALGWLFYNRNQLKQKAKLQQTVFEQQQLAASAVMKAEEKERQRIAKDLHDGVGQMMSAAKMNLSAFENEIQFSNADQKLSFERIIGLVDESCKEVRTVSHQMMPNMLLKSGLGKAVAEFLDKIDQKVIKVNLHVEGLQERLNEDVEIVLYRVLQECVNNVIKHSGASQLDIALIKDKDGISATIEDNGKGFDLKQLDEESGIGLKNMKARIDYLNGTIDFDSSPGKGTLVAIHLPLTQLTTGEL